MNELENFYGRIGSNELEFAENEVALRLKTNRGYTNDLIEKCKIKLLENVDCRYSAKRLAVKVSDNITDFGFFKVESKDLARLLFGCEECYVFCVTLGNKVDLLLKKLSASSLAEHYITDALSSALAESAADKAEEIIKNNKICTNRFSAGYGDFPLDRQADILSLLNARQYLGITLSKSFLMTPQKTITAVFGVKKD
ncbi:MAG: hypothetical protein IKU45_00460 [Clostridia bacterium]|nr:hypothetical protein [Clostridia bacterium]